MLTGPEAFAALTAARPLPIYLEGRLFPVQNDVAKELGLALHQTIRGTVEVRAEGNVLVLQGGRALELPPQLRFRPGEEVLLRLIQTPAGKALAAVPPQITSELGGSALARVEGGAQASALTGSAAGPLASLTPSVASLFVRPADFSGLAQLLSPGFFAGLSQLATAREAGIGPLAAWLKGRQAMGRVSADGVRQAFLQSGLFTESRLAQGQAVGSDLKIALQTALLALQEEGHDPALQDGLEASLRELYSAQADSLVSASYRELMFTFLIPFRDAPPAVIRFFRPRRRPDEPEPPITFDIHTQSPSLGELWLTAQLSAGEDLELTMWAEREEVATIAQKSVDELRGDLEDAGLDLRKMVVLHGRKPSGLDLPPGDQRPQVPGAVLDLKA